MRVCWSLAAGWRKQAANPHQQLESKALVVSVIEKAKAAFQPETGGEREPGQVSNGKTNASEPLMTRRNCRNDIKTGRLSLARDEF